MICLRLMPVSYSIHVYFRPNPNVLLSDLVEMLGLRAGCVCPLLLLLLSSAGVAEPVDGAAELCSTELRFDLSCELDDANKLESMPSFLSDFSTPDEEPGVKWEDVRRFVLPSAFCSFFDIGLSRGANDDWEAACCISVPSVSAVVPASMGSLTRCRPAPYAGTPAEPELGEGKPSDAALSRRLTDPRSKFS